MTLRPRANSPRARQLSPVIAQSTDTSAIEHVQGALFRRRPIDINRPGGGPRASIERPESGARASRERTRGAGVRRPRPRPVISVFPRRVSGARGWLCQAPLLRRRDTAVFPALCRALDSSHRAETELRLSESMATVRELGKRYAVLYIFQ